MRTFGRVLVSLAALAAAIGFRPAVSVPVPVVASPNVELLASFPNETGAVGGQVRTVNGKPYFLMTGVTGVSAYDVSNPALPVLAGHLPLPHFENESVDGRGNILLVDQDPGFTTNNGGGLYVIDVSQLPVITFAYTNPATGNRFRATTPAYNGGHTIACLRDDCSFAADVGSGGGSNKMTIFNLTDPANPTIASRFNSPVGGTHHWEMDTGNTAWVVGSGGVAKMDTTDPAAPVVVGQVYDPPALSYIHNASRRGNTLLVTEEDWLQPACLSQGQFATFDVTNVSNIQTLDIWAPPSELAPHNQTGVVTCSAHWFTERNGMVAIGWYQEGTYFLDVTNPADIKLAGFYAPANSTAWAAYWVTDDIVYVTDNTRGLEVLRVTRPASATAIKLSVAAAGATPRVPPSDMPVLKSHPFWGIACSIPTRSGLNG
jgi:hypothetical protein